MMTPNQFKGFLLMCATLLGGCERIVYVDVDGCPISDAGTLDARSDGAATLDSMLDAPTTADGNAGDASEEATVDAGDASAADVRVDVRVDAGPLPWQGETFFGDISDAPYRYISFVSRNARLPMATQDYPLPYRLNLETGVAELASVGLNGAMPNGSANKPRMSGDGRYVVFMSRATNLVSNTDTNDFGIDVFWRDMQAGVTQLVSARPDNASGNAASSYPSVSDDGRYVVFSSQATDLVAGDNNNIEDIFLRDMVTSTTTRISHGSNNAEADGPSVFARISGDGSAIVYATLATNLVQEDNSSRWKVVLFNRVANTHELISVAVDGSAANAESYSVSELSQTGRYVIFTSAATNLIASDANAQIDAFVRDRLLAITWRVSGNGNGAVGVEGLGVSNNGQTAVFASTATNLVANDSNAAADVFVARAGVIERIAVRGTNVAESTRPSLSSDGRRTIFETLIPVDDDDDNTLSDVVVVDLMP